MTGYVFLLFVAMGSLFYAVICIIDLVINVRQSKPEERVLEAVTPELVIRILFAILSVIAMAMAVELIFGLRGE
jgi:hypothetical protein